MSEKDAECGDCVLWQGSYERHPCKDCSTVFSGRVINFYRPPDGAKGREGGVSSPQHYQLFDGELEVIDLIEDRLRTLNQRHYSPVMYFNYGNTIKYLMRWPVKDGQIGRASCRERG